MFALDEIRIWNRTDKCCTKRLSNFYVFVSDLSGRTFNDILNDDTVWHHHTAGQSPTELVIPAEVNGRYVRVQLAGRNFLSLAEVQVFGFHIQLTRVILLFMRPALRMAFLDGG